MKKLQTEIIFSLWKNQTHLLLRARSHYFTAFYIRYWKIWKLNVMKIEYVKKRDYLIQNVLFASINPGISEMAGLGQGPTINKKKAIYKVLFVLAAKKHIFKRCFLHLII
jgi:hypothetical protein